MKGMGVQVPGELNSCGTGVAAQDFLWPPGVLLQGSPTYSANGTVANDLASRLSGA